MVKLSKKKKPKAVVGSYKNRCDYHHILFQGRHWKCGWAKTLREHPYCGAYIPQATLHREIHSKVHDIPTPNGADCKNAVEMIDKWLDLGCIDLNDRLDKKIETLSICFNGNCPATTAMLNWQKEIVSKFYSRGG